MDIFYKQNSVNNKQRQLLYVDLIIDAIMKRDHRFKNRETVYDQLRDIEVNLDNWLNIWQEVDHFFEVRDLERRIKNDRLKTA